MNAESQRAMFPVFVSCAETSLGRESSNDSGKARCKVLKKGKNPSDECEAQFPFETKGGFSRRFCDWRKRAQRRSERHLSGLCVMWIESGLENSDGLKMREPLFFLSRLMEGQVAGCQSQ
jgi:hypothetical protein